MHGSDWDAIRNETIKWLAEFWLAVAGTAAYENRNTKVRDLFKRTKKQAPPPVHRSTSSGVVFSEPTFVASHIVIQQVPNPPNVTGFSMQQTT
jgi:hypothetical protein